MIIFLNLLWLFVANGLILELTAEQSSYQSESPKTCLAQKYPVFSSGNRTVLQCFTYNQEPDLTLVIGWQLIRAHLRFVRQSIPYFDVPASDIKSRINSVETQNLDPNAVKDIFSFVYTQQLIIADENVLQLLRAAHFMKMENLAQTCIDFVIRRINERNVIDLLNFSALHYIWVLRIPAEEYVQKHFAKVSTNQEFLQLGGDAFLRILRSNEIRDPSEEHVYEATKRWIDHKPTERSALSFQVYEHIRFPLMKPDYFYQTVVPTLSSNAQLQGFLTEYDEYHNKGKQSKVDGCRTWPRTGTTKILVVPENKTGSYLEFFDPLKQVTKMASQMTQPIYACSVINCNLYMINAEETTKNDIYNPKSDSWRSTKGTSVYRKWHRSAVLNGLIYVSGGLDKTHVYILSSFESFNPITETWTQLASMSEKRACHSLVAFDGDLYAIGGMKTSTVEKYNIATSRWTTVTPMLNERQQFGSAVLDEKLYVCGGYVNGKLSNSAEVFDKISQRWTEIKSMPRSAGDFSLLAYQGKLWAISNMAIDVYDPYNDMWTEYDNTSRSDTTESFLINF